MPAGTQDEQEAAWPLQRQRQGSATSSPAVGCLITALAGLGVSVL